MSAPVALVPEALQRPGREQDLARIRPVRSVGEAGIAFKSRKDRTSLDRLFQHGCLKVRPMRVPPGALAEFALINTAGGLTGHDRLTIKADWADGAAAVISTPAAEKIYRSEDGAATIHTTLTAAEGAGLVWLPQETIYFDGAQIDRRLTVDLAEDAWCLIGEMSVFGRTAMGETVTQGAVVDRWRIRRGGRLVFADTFRLNGAIADRLSEPAIAGGAAAMATLYYGGPHVEVALDAVRKSLPEGGSDSGVTRLGPGLLVRLLAPGGQALTARYRAVVATLLGYHLSRSSACSPRLWSV